MTASFDASSSNTFAYVAQTYDGQPMTGTIDATDLEDAARRLAGLRLRIMRLDPAQRASARAKPLGGEDFAAFNQQLAYLAAAGLPIEHGLRLIAEDLQSGGLAQSVREVSAELDRGVALGEAFKLHERQFPPLYGAIIDAGIRADNLPAALLNLGRHLELVARLRAAIWRAAAYPLTVLAGLLVVLIFLGHFVVPIFQNMFAEWHTALPLITQFVFAVARATPVFIALALVLFVALPLLRISLRTTNLNRAIDDLALYLPLVGPLLRRNLIARWCDAMKLAVQSGMDLPAAVQLAADVVGSPAVARDSSKVIAQLNSGGYIDQITAKLWILPAPVLAVAQLAADRNDLPASLETLTKMYEQQAEMRLAAIQTLLTPALILLVGLLIGTVVLGLFAPLISLFRIFG
jgi:type IV pilus assembly protein PilC